MHRTTLGAMLAGSVVAALLLTGSAIAAPVPTQNPASPTCGEALRDLTNAQIEVREAQAAFDALPERVPNPNLPNLEKAVVDAKAALLQALEPTLEYDATDPGNVYSGLPGGAPPASAEGMTLAFLLLIKADPDLGGGAREEVNVAIVAYGKLATAEKALENGRTIPNPDRSSGAVFDRLDDAKDVSDDAQEVADKACEGQQGDPGPPAPRPRPVVPNTSSGVDTGDGSLG